MMGVATERDEGGADLEMRDEAGTNDSAVGAQHTAVATAMDRNSMARGNFYSMALIRSDEEREVIGVQ